MGPRMSRNFRLGLPLVMLGAAIYFIGYAGPKDPFSRQRKAVKIRTKLSDFGPMQVGSIWP